MNKWLSLMGVFIFFCAGSTTADAQKSGHKAELLSLQKRWLTQMNSGGRTDFLYSPASGLMFGDSLYVGSEAIVGKWKRAIRDDKLIRYDTIASFQLYEDQLFVHGSYYSEKGLVYESVTGWKKGQAWLKVFEAIGQKERVSEDFRTEIGLLRSSWELYSNQHRPDLIAKNVFSGRGRYFYKGMVYKGPQIAEAYGYMKAETYSINLTPQKLIPVNDQLIFEIGIFDVGGKGLYFLQWGREKDDWKLSLDFNF